MAVRSDAFLVDPQRAHPKHGLLLAEPTLVPDLGHLGYRGVPSQPTAHQLPVPAAAPQLFYFNGAKSLGMRDTIRATVKELLRQNLDPPPRPPGRSKASQGIRGPYGQISHKKVRAPENTGLPEITSRPSWRQCSPKLFAGSLPCLGWPYGAFTRP